MGERESLEVDVLIVGGGPAGLAAAYHLRKLNKDVSIAVLEKGKEIGAHIISGAVMDPRGINELMPDWGGTIGSPNLRRFVTQRTRCSSTDFPTGARCIYPARPRSVLT